MRAASRLLNASAHAAVAAVTPAERSALAGVAAAAAAPTAATAPLSYSTRRFARGRVCRATDDAADESSALMLTQVGRDSRTKKAVALDLKSKSSRLSS